MKIQNPPRIKPTGPMIAGLPTFTPAQFHQVQPKGSYAAYRKWINTKRGVIPGKPAWPGSGGPGLPTLMSMMRNLQFETPAQIEARANRMTASQIAAQKGLVVDEAKRAQDDALRRMNAMSAAGRAAANLNQGLFSSVGGEFNRGAQELANMGTGVVGNAVAGTDANVAATNEALARVGAPGIQPGVMAGPAQAGVTAFRYSGLPAQALAEQGQAAQFGLAGMVGAQNLRATQEAEAASAQAGHEIQQNRAAALAEIARGRPQVAAKILEDLQAAQRQQTALGMSLLEARRGALQTGFEQGITKQTTAQDIKVSNAQIKAAEQKIKDDAKAAGIEGSRIDASASRVAGILIDRNGNPILGKNGQPIPVAKTAGGTNAAGLTPLQQQKQYEKAEDRIQALFYGYKTVNAKIDPKTGKAIPGTGKRLPAHLAPGFDEDNPNTWGQGSVQYTNAIARLQQLGISRPQATALANQYYERGDSGRPFFTAPQQKAIKRKLNAIFGAKEGPREWNRQITAIQRAYNEGRTAEGDALLQNLENTPTSRGPGQIPDRPRG